MNLRPARIFAHFRYSRKLTDGAGECRRLDAPSTIVELLISSFSRVGRAINPHIVHCQGLGRLVQGLGGVFPEPLIYDRMRRCGR